MAVTTVQAVVAAAQQLSPVEQLEVIQALTRVLQQQYLPTTGSPSTVTPAPIVLPNSVRRAPPVTNLQTFAADFWPEEETADAITHYLTQQRATDRLADLPEREDAP